jgi:hypothetical protein
VLGIEGLGPFGVGVCAQCRGNMEKVEGGLQATKCQGSSLLAVLRSEAAAGIHGKGGVLQDPSAAIGVLWIGRFVAFWEQVCDFPCATCLEIKTHALPLLCPPPRSL